MKTYKWFFLIFVSSILISCNRTSEEELIGDWQSRVQFPYSPRAFAATFVIGNAGYVIGGTNGNKVLLNDVLAFNHEGGLQDIRGNSKGSWGLSLKPFPGPARQQAVGFSLNNYGYIGTGWSYDDEREDVLRRDFWRYNPADDSWEEIAPLPETAKGRRAAVAFALKVGDIEYGYVGCGYDGENYLLDFWRYDPVHDEWTQEESVGTKKAGAAAFVIDNRAYICNGESASAAGKSVEFLMFDPNAAPEKRWTNLRTMANSNPDEDYDDDYGGLARSFGVAYVAWTQEMGGQLRGHIAGGNTATNWEYNHVEDLWTQRTTFYNNNRSSVQREGMISFSFPTGRGYVGLGRSGVTYYDDMWEFVPSIDDYTYDDNY